MATTPARGATGAPSFSRLAVLRVTRWLPLLTLLLAVTGIMIPVFLAEQRETWDHGFYLEYAVHWYITGQPDELKTHIGYPLLLMALIHQVRRDPLSLAVAINVGANAAAALITYGVLVSGFSVHDRWRHWWSAGLSLLLVIAAPIVFLTLPAHNLYYGYIVPNIYHNPPSILLKPLALAQAVLVGRTLIMHRAPLWTMPLLFVVSTAAIITKPSFAVCLLPPVVLLMLIRLLRRDPMDFAALAIGFVLPTLLALIAQAAIFSVTRGSVYFAPLEALRLNSDNAALDLLPVKQWLSILFPLMVFSYTRRTAARSPTLIVIWLSFGVGWAQMLLLNEPIHPKAGNWWWGAQTALFVLFVFSTRFLIEQRPHLSLTTRRVLWGILALHGLGGVVWWGIHAAGYLSHPLEGRIWW